MNVKIVPDLYVGIRQVKPTRNGNFRSFSSWATMIPVGRRAKTAPIKKRLKDGTPSTGIDAP